MLEDEVIKKVRQLKSLAIEAREDEDWDAAHGHLTQAEGLLEGELEALDKYNLSHETQRSFRAQLANIRGTRGGVYRRQEMWKESTEAYELGSKAERLLDDSGSPSTYNMVQR